MGHTVWSQRMLLDTIMAELEAYGRALRESDRKVYESLLKRAFRHYGATSYASSMHAWAFLLLSIMLEQEKLRLENARSADGRLQAREEDHLLAQDARGHTD